MACGLFGATGTPVSVIRDSAGLVTQRVVAHIINIACEIAQHGIAQPADIDRAVMLGLGYPAGPLAWGDRIGAATILTILTNLEQQTGDPRYRPSPWLRRRAMLGLPLHHKEI
jgi:3-hydroxybutyryl-CoA dehydrogenase